MKFLDRIKIRIGKDKNLLAQKGLEQVKEILENAEEDEIEKIAKMVSEKLTKGMPTEEIGEFAQEFTNLLVKQEEIPNDVPLEYISAMLKEEEIPNEYVIEPAKDLPDAKLRKLTEKTSIPIDDRRELIEAMENEEIRQEQLEKINEEEKRKVEIEKRKELDMLKRVYNTCDMKEILDAELADLVNSIKEQIRYLSIQEIEEWCAKIVAKKIAYNISRFGNSNLSYLSQMISIKDMRRLGIVKLAEEEYYLVEGIENKKKFKNSAVHADLSAEIEKRNQEIKNTADDEKEIKEISDLLRKLPQNERRKKLEEIKMLISLNKENKDIEEGRR